MRDGDSISPRSTSPDQPTPMFVGPYIGSVRHAQSLDNHPDVWTHEHERVLLMWKNHCDIKVSEHFHLGCFYSYLYAACSVPAVIIPALCSQITKMGDPDNLSFVESLLIVSTFCSGVLSIFNFGRRSEQHFTVQHNLSKVAHELDVEPRKVVQLRQPCQVFMIVKLYQIETTLAKAPGDGGVTQITSLLKFVWRVSSFFVCSSRPTRWTI